MKRSLAFATTGAAAVLMALSLGGFRGLAYWVSTGRGRPHYLIASMTMLGLSALQWFGFIEPGKQTFSVFGLVLGAIYIIGGLLDHRELCRILRPVNRS